MRAKWLAERGEDPTGEADQALAGFRESRAPWWIAKALRVLGVDEEADEIDRALGIPPVDKELDELGEALTAELARPQRLSASPAAFIPPRNRKKPAPNA